MATLEEQLQALYQENLGRTAGQSGLDFYLGELASGSKTMDQIAADLAWAAEHSPVETTGTTARGLWAAEDPVDSYANIGKYTLEDLYREELGRTNISDEALQHYQDKIDAGYSPAQIRAELNASVEGQAYDAAAEGKAINTGTGAIISGTPEEYQQYVDTFGTGTIVNDGYTDIKRMYPNASYPLDMLDADTVNALREDYGQELLTSSPNDLWTPSPSWTPAEQPTYESNYGQYGKRADESLTDYYSRLATERQGGILGQGMLSATPTVGSAAWEKLQQVATSSDPTLSAAAQGLSSGNYEPFINAATGFDPANPYANADAYNNSQKFRAWMEENKNNPLVTTSALAQIANWLNNTWLNSEEGINSSMGGSLLTGGPSSPLTQEELNLISSSGSSYTPATVYSTTNSSGIDTADPMSGITVGDVTSMSDAEFEANALANGLN